MKFVRFLELKAEVDRMTVDREQGEFPAASALWYDWQSRIQIARSRRLRPKRQVYWDWILERIPRREKIADFGCGCGGFAWYAIESRKSYVLGIDFSSVAIARAQKLNPEYSHCFRCEDLNSTRGRDTLKHAVYDTAVLTEVLEHVNDDLEILRGVPSGRRVLLSVPSFSARGHCRWFTTLEAASDRYSKLISIQYSSALSYAQDAYYWLIDGVRK